MCPSFPPLPIEWVLGPCCASGLPRLSLSPRASLWLAVSKQPVSLATADLDAEVCSDLPYNSAIGIPNAVKRGGYLNSPPWGYQIIHLSQTTKGLVPYGEDTPTRHCLAYL